MSEMETSFYVFRMHLFASLFCCLHVFIVRWLYQLCDANMKTLVNDMNYLTNVAAYLIHSNLVLPLSQDNICISIGTCALRYID